MAERSGKIAPIARRSHTPQLIGSIIPEKHEGGRTIRWNVFDGRRSELNSYAAGKRACRYQAENIPSGSIGRRWATLENVALSGPELFGVQTRARRLVASARIP